MNGQVRPPPARKYSRLSAAAERLPCLRPMRRTCQMVASAIAMVSAMKTAVWVVSSVAIAAKVARTARRG